MSLRHAVRATCRVVASDLALFRRFPRLGVAVLAIAMVPAAYALIYLSSVWDPHAKTSDLPVGLVNLDQGMEYRGFITNVGDELSRELLQDGSFGFRTLRDAQAAREAVKLGQLAFAVIIPPEFSANALPGYAARAGKITVVLSEGNNYAAAGYARRFAEDLGHRVNEALNEKRWEQVLISADGSGKSLAQLKAGMAQLQVGAQTYVDGMARYGQAATQLANGFKQVGAGVRGIEARVPPETELKSFKAGTQRLAQRQHDMGAGLEQLQTGARKLTQGARLLQEDTAGIPFVGDRIAAGAGELAAGGQQLSDGLTTALDAHARLSRGASRVDEGAGKLVDSATALGEALRTLTERMPEDALLESFARQGDELVRGAAKLRTGIELVSSALPAGLGKPDGSARGLAESVEPSLEVLAPVANNGSAFAPNMIAMALWLGAVMALYVFNAQQLAEPHARAPLVAQALGKLAAPALLVLAQTGLIFVVMVAVLGIAVPNYGTFTLSMVAAGQTFLAIVYLLLRALGEAGKLIVILLLTLQLAAGGGVMPIELTTDVFQAVHQWLPFTWVIKTLRASLFGAYGQGWLQAWLEVLLIGGVAVLLCLAVRRWQVVPAAEYRPGINL